MNPSLLLPKPPVKPYLRLLTVADVAALPSSLPTGDVRYELDNGELVVMAPPGEIHGHGQARIVTQIMVQGELAGHGKAYSEVGIILRRRPDRLVAPDAAFIMKKSLPVRRSAEGYLETIPELVVEVRSKNDTQPEIDAKVDEYLEAGVVVVWVPDPMRRCVMEYRPDQVPREWGPDDLLIVDDVIPGFQVRVASLFD